MTSLLCQLNIHNYTRLKRFWKEVVEDKGAAVIEKEVKYEKHKCLRCGKIKKEPYLYRNHIHDTPHKKIRNKTTRWKNENSSTE